MSDEVKADKTMDLKGLPCPQPVIKVSKGIKEIQVGQVLQAITTDPGALADFPAWARTSGNEILKTDQGGGLITFWINHPGGRAFLPSPFSFAPRGVFPAIRHWEIATLS